jgi:hypothetical protein
MAWSGKWGDGSWEWEDLLKYTTNVIARRNDEAIFLQRRYDQLKIKKIQLNSICSFFVLICNGQIVDAKTLYKE